MGSLQMAQKRDFENGALAAAVVIIAGDQGDPVAQSLLFEAASKLDWAAKELARRDANERRNCLNWGPCSANDGHMSEGPRL